MFNTFILYVKINCFEKGEFSMSQNYDVIIVGAGPMGYFTAYELMKKAPNYKVFF